MTSPNEATPTLTILGARGSIPVSGPGFWRYGGNTTNMALSVDGEAFAFLDAGTALIAYRDFGLVLKREVAVFLTHYHWDHIQGLSMLGEMWDGNCTVDIYGEGSPHDMLTRAISPPWFPVSMAGQSNIAFNGVSEPVEIGALTFTAFGINHPQGAVGYRIDGPTSSVAVITDHETDSESTPRILAAVDGVDCVVYDAQYLPSEMASHLGWGHSTWEDAVQFASDVGAGRLILTSHDPRRTDDEVDAIIASASESFPEVEAAVPGLTIEL